MNAMNRRLILRLLLAAMPLIAMPEAAKAATRDYRGWTIDDAAIPGGLNDAGWNSLKTQIDLVESIAIKPEIKAYFRAQILTLDPNIHQPGRAGPRGLFLSANPQPHDNPVLLHELIHVYHLHKLTDGVRNAALIGFYEAAKRGGFYPPQAYLLTNVLEFLAMNASVVLWGRAARPPYLRATVQHNQPNFYAWIVNEFGLTL